MSTTRTVNGTAYHLTTNRHERETFPVVFDDVEGWRRLTGAEWGTDTGNDGESTGFEYRGNIYALSEFEQAGHDVKALGFDGVQGTSYWDAIVVGFFDRDGHELEGVTVGHLSW